MYNPCKNLDQSFPKWFSCPPQWGVDNTLVGDRQDVFSWAYYSKGASVIWKCLGGAGPKIGWEPLLQTK